MNKQASMMAFSIGACALSVVLVMLKCLGVPISWLVVLLPVGLVALVWLVAAIIVLVICLATIRGRK